MESLKCDLRVLDMAILGRGPDDFVGIAVAAHTQPTDLMRQIAGSWFLADESLTFPDGRTIKSWGKEPYGYLGFDGDSHFSMMMIRSDLPRFENAWEWNSAAK
jgi:hypothetical protein